MKHEHPTGGSHGRSLLCVDGSVAVELALLAPLLVTLVVGISDFGNLLNSSEALAAAARIGAEYAKNSPTCQGDWATNSTPSAGCTTGIRNAVTNSMAFVPALAAPSVLLTCECESTAIPSTYSTCSGPTSPPFNSCFTSPPAVGYTGPNRVFVTIGATQSFTPMISWPGMPATLAAVTKLRLQ